MPVNDDRDDDRHLDTRTPPDSMPPSTTHGDQDREQDQVEKQGEAGPRKFYGMRDPGIRGDVKGTFKMFGGMLAAITILLWIVLPLFWGSTWLLEHYFYRINIDVIDFDSSSSGSSSNALLGPVITQGLMKARTQDSVTLGWDVRNASLYPNGLEDVQKRVLTDACWGAVVINANATSAWQEALRTGNNSYDPTGSIVVYVSSARFFQVIREYQIPLIDAVLPPLISNASSTALKSFFSQFSSGTSSNNTNTTALELALASPAAIGQVFSYHLNDLRPIIPGTWSVEGPLEAGLLYGVIFCFQFLIWENDAYTRTGLKKKLRLGSLIGLRLGIPAIAYFFFSLWYTTLLSAFQIPLTHILGHSGWLAAWALNYLSFLALGLAMEVAITVLGIRGMPFFLILWIILNITSSFLPIALMENFYEWLKWTPFYHNTQALKTIVYGQRIHPSKMGLNYGVIIAVAFVNCCTLSLATVYERWRDGHDYDADGNGGDEKREAEGNAREEEDGDDLDAYRS